MRNLRLEIKRKIFHIISILSLLFPLYVFGKWSVAFVMFFFLVFVFFVVYWRVENVFTSWFWRLLEHVEREENIKTFPARQAFSLGVGMLISSVFFPEEVLQICIVSVAVYDGFATIGGIFFGRHKLPNGKSIEGTLSGLFLNTLFLLPFLNFLNAFFVSVFVAVVENISSPKRWYLDDNLLIPVLTGLFMVVLDIPAKIPQFFSSFW